MVRSVMVAVKKSEKKEEDFAVNEDFHPFIHPSIRPIPFRIPRERETGRGVHVTSGEYLLPIFFGDVSLVMIVHIFCILNLVPASSSICT